MTETQDNPYESPGSDAAPIDRVTRRFRLPAAIALTLLASSISFCCVCFPLGAEAAIADLNRYHAQNAGEDPNRWAARAEYWRWWCWVGGGAAAAVVGFVVWSWLRRPKRSPLPPAA
ncbi:hypothetical protein [Posidoniimonas polymericola]|uniref:hypothetical protein n=1 Tax=Posidoniimonas polymericola TaxID=2528002 RepID=UPI001E5F8566|nr:hypothetical protein [Posidoniimonas polymericola]